MQEHKIHVVAAVMKRDDKFLICKRPLHKRHGGLWEFPGGKVAQGESPGDALMRELQEELKLHVDEVGSSLLSIEDPGSQFVIEFFEVESEGIPEPTEHDEIAWVEKMKLLSFELAPSDKAFGEFLNGVNSPNDQVLK